ncbi:hypothetical protein [Microbacterium capsulatum]|nr:hypothetical protein [Microbacterium sp. ASV81]
MDMAVDEAGDEEEPGAVDDLRAAVHGVLDMPHRSDTRAGDRDVAAGDPSCVHVDDPRPGQHPVGWRPTGRDERRLLALVHFLFRVHRDSLHVV